MLLSSVLSHLCVGWNNFSLFLGSSNVWLPFQCSHTSVSLQTKIDIFQVYDAINDDVELPNIDYPDSDASKAIVEFHACEFFGQRDTNCVHSVIYYAAKNSRARKDIFLETQLMLFSIFTSDPAS